MEYNVQLETFRGPLDLLLFLVKRHEVDIRDIPIARVAEQFLEYLHAVQLIDVEWAGDFLVMAATLMEIKSKMLLPRSEEEAAEEDDPRLELVKQLIEYKKYKEAAGLLEEQAERQLARLPRWPLEVPEPLDPAHQPLRRVELWDLVSAFGRLMRETNALLPRQIVMDPGAHQSEQDPGGTTRPVRRDLVSADGGAGLDADAVSTLALDGPDWP
jgi:segregation and condensation protein A